MKKVFFLVFFFAALNFSYSQIIFEGAVWKYLDDGSNQVQHGDFPVLTIAAGLKTMLNLAMVLMIW